MEVKIKNINFSHLNSNPNTEQSNLIFKIEKNLKIETVESYLNRGGEIIYFQAGKREKLTKKQNM